MLAGRAVGLPIPMAAGDERLIEPDAGRATFYDRLYREAYAPLYDALRPINHALDALR